MEQYKSKKKWVTYISEEGFTLIKDRLSAYINNSDSTKSICSCDYCGVEKNR